MKIANHDEQNPGQDKGHEHRDGDEEAIQLTEYPIRLQPTENRSDEYPGNRHDQDGWKVKTPIRMISLKDPDSR